MAFFAGAAQEAIVVERALHDSYFDRFGLSEAELNAVPDLADLSRLHLVPVGDRDDRRLPGAGRGLLPCFWVYQQVGEHIVARPAGRC